MEEGKTDEYPYETPQNAKKETKTFYPWNEIWPSVGIGSMFSSVLRIIVYLIIEPRSLATKEDIKKETLTQIAAYFAFDTSVIENIISENPNSMYQHVE